MVSSASRLASEVGVETLRNGGNAVDAAVATAFALAVTWPSAGNIGGGGFLVYHGSDGQRHGLRFSREGAACRDRTDVSGSRWPGREQFQSFRGSLAVGVPGTVAGLWKAHQELGSLPWADLVAPAVALAREGIPITYTLQRSFAGNQRRFQQYPSSAAVFAKADGSLYEMGDTWVQRDLAATLELIRDNGRDGFYAG